MYLTNGVVFLINVLFPLYIYVILLRILLELARADYYNVLCQFVLTLTDRPVLLLQRIVPRLRLFDLPAVVLLLAVECVKLFLLCAIYHVSVFTPLFLLKAFADILDQLINLYGFLIIFYVLMSWLQTLRSVQLALPLRQIIEPILAPVRRVVPPIAGIDLSPLITLILLFFIHAVMIVPMINKSLLIG